MSILKKRLKRFVNRSRFVIYTNTPKSKMPFYAAFVIGTYKTGTTSMNHFLSSLGLRHLTINSYVKERYAQGDFDYLDRLTRHFHSFDDNPWHRLDVIERYMQSDEDNRFILTTREAGRWFESYTSHQLSHGLPRPIAKETFVRDNLLRHNDACRELAAKYSKPLLEVDVTTSHDSAKLITQFLGMPDRGVGFPHSNAAVKSDS